MFKYLCYLCSSASCYIPEESKVLYRPKDGKKENIFDVLEWLVPTKPGCSHVPNKGEQMVRYYGHAGSNVVKEIIDNKSTAIFTRTDVKKLDEARSMAELTLNKFGTIDILVNVAGRTGRGKGVPFNELKKEIWNLVVDTNLKGTFNCTRSVVETMVQKRGGKIINIASAAGITGGNRLGRQVDYSAAKAGVIGFTKALAKEVGPYNINVHSVFRQSPPLLLVVQPAENGKIRACFQLH